MGTLTFWETSWCWPADLWACICGLQVLWISLWNTVRSLLVLFCLIFPILCHFLQVFLLFTTKWELWTVQLGCQFFILETHIHYAIKQTQIYIYILGHSQHSQVSISWGGFVNCLFWGPHWLPVWRTITTKILNQYSNTPPIITCVNRKFFQNKSKKFKNETTITTHLLVISIGFSLLQNKQQKGEPKFTAKELFFLCKLKSQIEMLQKTQVLHTFQGGYHPWYF